MLPSTGYFKGINCPFYESGLCERPYCHFRHVKKETDINSDPLENGEILQKLVSEAVKKALEQTDNNPGAKAGALQPQQLISKVVEELTPATSNKSASPAKVTYNPTPISELNKLAPTNDVFVPAPSRKEYLNRKHIPVPYTPHRPRTHGLRTARAEPSSAPAGPNVNSLSLQTEKYTPVAMECESSVKYLPGSLLEHKPPPYSPLGTFSDSKQLADTGSNAYTPTDKANINEGQNVALYTPSGRSVSGATYSPGTLSKADYSSSSYCPTNTMFGANSVNTKSSSYSSTLSYEPTPLGKTTLPKFSSDEEDEPEIKKPKITRSPTDDIQDSDLDSEFEILGKILEDENECEKSSQISSNDSTESEKLKKSSQDKVKPSLSKLEPSKVSSGHSKSKVSSKSLSKSDNKSEHKSVKSEHKSDKNNSKDLKSEHKSSKSEHKSSKSDHKSSKSEHKPSKNEHKSSKSEHKSSKSNHKFENSPNNHSSKSLTCESEKTHGKRDSEKKLLKKESPSVKHNSSKTQKDSKEKSKHSSDKSKDHTSSSKSKPSEHKSSHKSTSSKSGHTSRSSSSDKKKSDKDKTKHSSKRSDTFISSTSDRSDKKHKEKEVHKSSKKSSKSEDKPIAVMEVDSHNNFESDTELIEEFSDSDEEKITQECLKIFEEFVPTTKEIINPQNSGKQTMPSPDTFISKKRVAHNTGQTIYRTATSVLPDHKSKAVLLATDRYSKVKLFHESRMKRLSAEGLQVQPVLQEPCSSSSKVRIAHVPNVSTLLNAKKALLALEPSEPPKATAVQTVTKGTSRVAHMPNDKFCERPGVLEPLGSKIPVNIRSRYFNLMIDECLKIYITAEDAYARAQQEELNTNKKCTAIPIYKNSAVMTVSRLRKEVHESGGVKINICDPDQRSFSHNKLLLGKLADSTSWSIENKHKKDDFSQEFKGLRFFENISRWVMSEEELRNNGFPRPHPEKKDKGCAKIFTQNTRQKPQVGNMRTCCRCKKEYVVNKKGIAIRTEECFYHPNNKYRFRGEVKYQCCGQDTTSDGCLSASCHVYEYVDHDNLRGFVRTLPKDHESDNEDHGVYALDCEMCYTSNGLDLTRVTVIDNTLNVVYESLVKPIHPIIDYNTRYSGLTEENMRDVSTTLLEVQATFLHMFSDKTILVGHSLESDFKALKLIHNTVVDTSVLFPHKMGPPYKRALRNLSSEFMKKIIQNSLDGHDSAEDATVCMELLIWKLREELKTR